jgi:outer membrane protein, adhesin transport system
VDGASFRVLERSETVALQVVQDYLEYILQTKIVGVAKRNADFHDVILSDTDQGIPAGPLNEVHALQGRERLEAARARLREAQEELELTKIRFLKAVSEPITIAKVPGGRNSDVRPGAAP